MTAHARGRHGPGRVVLLHVWRVPRRAVPLALLRMAVDRFRLGTTGGLVFGRLLGTSAGFRPRDADPTRYAALTVWTDEAAAARYDAGPVVTGWRRLSGRHAALVLSPVSSRGRWGGREPFAPADRQQAREGPVLVLTRARLRPSRALSFWRAVPAVAAEFGAAPGVLASFGVGEAPIGWQGTVSVWRDTAHLVDFAYRQPQHRAAIARTATDGWYAEELFVRFAVRAIHGDRSALGWRDE